MDGRGSQMNDDNKKDDTFETVEILENVTVIHKNNNRELFDAIHITCNAVLTGQILKIDKTEPCKSGKYCETFVESGIIPKDNVKRIEGGTRRTVYKKKS